MKFDEPFAKTDVYFNNKKVQGFKAATSKQRKQVLIHKY